MKRKEKRLRQNLRMNELDLGIIKNSDVFTLDGARCGKGRSLSVSESS